MEYRKQRPTWNRPRDAHFLTYSCFNRLPLLRPAWACRLVVRSMDAMRRKLDVAIWAYVVMPEHVHVLLWPRTDPYEMRRIRAALKQPVSVGARQEMTRRGEASLLRRLRVVRPTGTVFRFWLPGGGHDRNIRCAGALPELMRYVHENPVRRGLVDRCEDWPWSSAGYWAGQPDPPLRLDDPADML